MIVNQSLFEWSINKKNGFLSLSFVNFRETKCPKFIIFCKIAKIIAREIFVFQIREIKCPRKLVRIRYSIDEIDNRGGFGEFETVMQTRDVVSNFREFSQPSEC